MGTTIYANDSPLPSSVAAPIIESKAAWSDDWEYEPELDLDQATVATNADGNSQATIRRQYGEEAKWPWELGFSERLQRYMIDRWIRVSFVVDGETIVVFVGRITTEARRIDDTGPGSDPANGTGKPQGEQTWVVRGAQHLLQRVDVSTAFWWDDQASEVREIGHIPDMNALDEQRVIIGNRSADLHDDAYIFGGTDTWNHLQFCEYLLDRFMTTDAGPTWRMGGQTDVLEALTTHVKFRNSQSVGEMLTQLINASHGLDFCVFPFVEEAEEDQPGDAGFELFVYALTAENIAFGNATLPRNPNEVKITAPLPRDVIGLELAASGDQQYRAIRVYGRRIVVCTTLHAPTELEGKWTEALEDAYRDGAGEGYTAAEHDQARMADKFRTVYQQFGAPSVGLWDVWPNYDNGVFVNMAASQQAQIRNTLGWTPLQESFDYSVNPPEDDNPTGHKPVLLAPMVWLYAPGPFGAWAGKYVPAERMGINISVPRNDWGVILGSSPNHLVARDAWEGGEGGRPSETPGYFDETEMVATIAFRTDQRLELTWGLPGSEVQTVKDIEVPDAELWVLAPGTVVGVDYQGQLITSPDEPVELRNDTAKLEQEMVGAIARYARPRNRLAVTFNGLYPWYFLITQILTTIEAGGDETRVQAPLTSIEWTVPRGEAAIPRTIIRTGFAR